MIFCFRAYTPIVSAEQRGRYKSEFNQYYAKYRALHKVLDQVSKKFAHLESRLKEAPKGSQDFKVRIFQKLFSSSSLYLIFYFFMWRVDVC